MWSDRGGLLLHPGLPARHRGPGRRRAVAAGDAADRRTHAAGHAADVPAGGQGEPARAGLRGDAENLLPFWRGKLFVLVLLGFVATSWIITITLSAADASRPPAREPARPGLPARPRGADHGRRCCWSWAEYSCSGFSEAVGVAIPLVAVFLGLNAVVVVVGRRADLHLSPLTRSGRGPTCSPSGRPGWQIHRPRRARASRCSCWACPGFETGVSMMPLVAASGTDADAAAAARGSATPASCSPPRRADHERLSDRHQLRRPPCSIPAEEFEPGRRGQRSGPGLPGPPSTWARRSGPRTT